MQISKELAGFSGAKADDLRKAIGKKNRAAMAALKPEFVEGCRASGTSAEVIEFLWQTNEKSADYSFNKSHAACYALIAYRTAWLKANYPAEYMAALISSVMSTKDKVPFFVARCEEMGIEILPPDVNLSDHEFTVGPSRRSATSASAWTPSRASATRRSRRSSGRARRAGEFTSLWDFCERVDSRAVNKKAIEALIKCGAFGSTGATRKGMLEVLEQAQGAGQKAQQDALIGQGSIFDLHDGAPRRRAAGGRRRRRASGDRSAGWAWPARAPADPDRGVRPGRAAGGREGSDRPVRLRPPAEAAARGAARARGLPAGRARRSPRQGLGDGRRDHHRGQADPHPQRRPDDVRDARRPRGLGRAARVRQGAGRARGGAGRRRGRAREGPGRPQGSRQDLPGRADASSPSRRPQEEIERARAQAEATAADAPPRWPSRCTCASPPTRSRPRR